VKLDSFDDIEAAFQEVEQKRSQGDLLGAYDSCFAIVSQRLSAQLMDADLVIIHCLADLAILFGQMQAADDLLTGVAGKYQEVGAYHRADFAWLKRIHLALDRGFLNQADELLQAMAPRIGDIRTIQFSPSGLVQWEAGCDWPDADSRDCAILFAQLHLAMGRLLCALGQYSDALVTLNRGLAHTGEDAPTLARKTALPLKLAIAGAYLEKGDLATAQDNLTILKSELDENQYPEYHIRWLELSGKLHLLCGNLGQALNQFKLVPGICRTLNAHQAVFRATLNLAHVLILLNQTSFARAILTDAQTQALAADEPELVKRVSLLLRIANARGQSLVVGTPFAQSVSQMRRSKQEQTPEQTDDEHEQLSFTTQSANYLTFFEERALEFHWQLSRFNLVAAGNLLSQIQDAFQLSDSDLIRIKIKILEGILSYYRSIENQERSSINPDGIRWAASILDDVRPALLAMNLKPELWQVQRILGWCWSRLQYPVGEQEALAEETNRLLAQLTESLSPEDQAIYLLNKWTADEEYIASETNQLQRLQAQLNAGSPLLRPWRRWMVMQRLHALVEHIDRYKDVLVKRTLQGRNPDVQPVRTTALWQRLVTHPRKRVTLSFLVLPDRVFVVRSGRFRLDFAVIPTTRLEVRNLVQRWHETIQRVKGGRDLSAVPDDESYESVMASLANEGKTIAHQLAELLQIPSILQGLPKNTRSLTIIPDDILHGFPFASIIHQDKYLVEHYALAIAYESNNKRSSTPASVATQKALLVGVSQGTEQFRPLPAVGKELRQFEYWLTTHQIASQTLVDNAANKAAILNALSDATLLHMACHGTFEHNRPDQSGLVLISDFEHKEILSLRELSNLDLTGLRHATLSSCWSADHFILPGRWIISLPETLWRSGVQSILGCLWEVYDQLAVSFMTRFYEYLDELPRDEALRRTQLDCLQGRLPDCGNIDTANPLYWAGFNLYGDYRKIDLSLRQQRPAFVNPNVQKQQQELEPLRQQLQQLELDRQRLEGIAAQRLRQLQNAQQQVLRLETQQQELFSRFERHKEELQQQTKREVVRELLEVVDGFELARQQIPSAQEQQESIHRGYEGIYRLLVKSLEKMWVVAIEVVGQPFDPSVHEAVMAEVTNEHPDGTVIAEVKRGYLFDHIVLRPAQVKVATNFQLDSDTSEAALKDTQTTDL
jgi:molecular chaperone GrpE (heat shock protein)